MAAASPSQALLTRSTVRRPLHLLIICTGKKLSGTRTTRRHPCQPSSGNRTKSATQWVRSWLALRQTPAAPCSSQRILDPPSIIA